MKNKLTYVVWALAIGGLAAGSYGSEPETAATAMKKLDFLVGEWSGQGWIRMGPGEPQHFNSREFVESRIDGKALVVEGLHSITDGTVVHHALGVFTWDPANETYRFQTYVADRGAGSYTAWFEGDNLIWELDAGERRMRYTITLDDQGRWHETGVITIDGNSHPFFEMTLDKVE